ncbi:MAG: SAM-dependent methyltransferase [bacterium]
MRADPNLQASDAPIGLFGRAAAGARRAAFSLAEHGRLPDAAIRLGIRRLLAERLAELRTEDPEETDRLRRAFFHAAYSLPVATAMREANEQHYELPPAFFERVLGARSKYSCCDYGPGIERASGRRSAPDLDQAEVAMLRRTTERAGIEDGMRILDLGCGWGSLSIWMAEQYPNARILAVSNSKAQREHITARAEDHGLGNLRVRTADANSFEPEQAEAPFDRVVSVEMFEHMRGWPALFERIARWLAPEGRLFLHYFCHRTTPYYYEVRSESDWMSRHFFTGGIMPCFDLAAQFPEHLSVEESFIVDGRQYEQTCNDWLARLDAQREAILPILVRTYGESAARQWLGRWRLFFMACAELFGARSGSEWFVAHHRLAPVSGR